MKHDLLGYSLFIFIIIISYKLYSESDYFNLKCIISTVDGEKYCVRERKNMYEASDLLASTVNKMNILIEKLKEKYPDKDNVQYLIKNYNPKKIVEILPTSQYTAYSENKGRKIAFCLNVEKDNDNNLIGNATYIAGNTALDCKGATSSAISPNPLSGGTTTNATFTIVGRRKYFYDYKTDGILPVVNSANIRALSNSVLATSSNNFNGGQISINVPQYAQSIVVAYPSSWGDISIIDNASQLNLTDDVSSSSQGYYKTVVAVYGLNNLDPINYNVYHYTPAFFANPAIHIVSKI